MAGQVVHPALSKLLYGVHQVLDTPKLDVAAVLVD